MPKLLVVEDNEMNRTMLVRRLRRLGFEIVEAENGLEAVAAVHEHHPDLVLMDMNLPALDGWTATRTLKADLCTAATPVIALTAHAMNADREHALAVGCNDYVTKPIDLPQLLAIIKTLLPAKGADRVQ
jgi:two-component system cell cycle response regulator DivK